LGGAPGVRVTVQAGTVTSVLAGVHTIPPVIVAVAVTVEVPAERPLTVVVAGEEENEEGLTVATPVVPEEKVIFVIEPTPPVTVAVAVRSVVSPISTVPVAGRVTAQVESEV
jgi:hypothetical protein